MGEFPTAFHTKKQIEIVSTGAQTSGIEGLGKHVVNDSCGLRFPDQILLKLGESKLVRELVHGHNGAMPGEEAGMGGGVVAQLDQEEHREEGEGEDARHKPAVKTKAGGLKYSGRGNKNKKQTNKQAT